MSFWPFGQHVNSASDLNKTLEYYFQKRNIEAQSQQSQQSQNQDQLQLPHPLQRQQNNPPQTSSHNGSGNNSNDQLDQQDPDIPLNRQFVLNLLDDPSLLNELNRQNNKLIDFICFGYISQEEEEEKEELNPHPTLNDTAVSDESTSEATNSKLSTSSISVLEVLIDLIVTSFEWFDQNQELLLKANATEYQSNIGNKDEENDVLKTDDLHIELNRIHVASEILSCNIWLISETLVEEQALLSKLWKFLQFDLTNASPSVQFFVKINEQLLETRPDQMLNFIRSQDHLVDVFIKHIDITIIMDFLLRIITTDKADNPTGILELLSEQKLIIKLLKLLNSHVDPYVQSSCGDFLKALISISANTSIDENTIGPNILTKELVSDKCVDMIIEIILNKGNGLSTVVGVIIEIIRKNNSDYDSFNLLYTTIESHPPNKRDPIYLGVMLRKFAQNLPKFNSILFDSEISSKRIQNQIHQEIEVLGFERFKICELIAELLHCSNIGLLNNHLTEKIIEEREKFLRDQESNLANALNDEILDENAQLLNQKQSSSLNISNLNIGGTAEPSVALTGTSVTISPNVQPTASTGSDKLEDSTPSSSFVLQHDNKEVDSTMASEVTERSSVITKRELLRSNPVVGDEFKISLADSGILKTIITMFTKFPWNNFWHNVVFDIVQQIFNGRLDVGYNIFLILELFESCDITNLIIDAYNKCLENERLTNVRLGYMGHLVLIAEEVVKFSLTFQSHKFNDADADELIYKKLIDDNWVNYVTNVLTETREQYNCVLGGIKTQEFEQSEYLNQKAIILGNSEAEILNQPVDTQVENSDDDSTNGVYDSNENNDDDTEVIDAPPTLPEPELHDNDKDMTP